MSDAEGDKVYIRTDHGIMAATITTLVDEVPRPDDGARLAGTLDRESDDPDVHYVDYYHEEVHDDE